jgi:hypothetical protein
MRANRAGGFFGADDMGGHADAIGHRGGGGKRFR